jgi:hypothetical protein
MVTKETDKILKKQRAHNKNTAHVECKKTKIIPVSIEVIRTISTPFRKYLSNIPGKHEIKEVQKIVILGTAHVLPGTTNVNVQNIEQGK